ncbi:MAG TPA: DUF4931 domain-containing protein [bacterium]|jgi:UDPglucose--hexose-1-phosphate uridylyltransferase|nr:MAG: Galactose-1-phosphate uridylyltransferase [Parcubacteria group bacterium ADurb.Bin115]HNU81439.1 DUF4931 domain-containing protein [bacterium]HOD86983.1 DUF4931 domain-containing protein [bacterium]HQB76670.1 DUF4931 domain-containing protein [bacterium]HQM18730.1 DUF4931 domain-containing protein [Candidatus Paceibacterota bacterium]
MKNQAQIRYNPLNGRSIIFAPKRAKRPNDLKNKTKESSCPFCSANVKKTNILQQWPSSGKWQSAAIKNIYPALSNKNKNAYGYQEIIIDSGHHYENFLELNLKQISSLLKLFQLRNQALSKDKKIKYILTFKNQGRAAGASLRHIHSQIFASSILPPEIIEERNRTARYQAENKVCPYCLLINNEQKSQRLVWQDSKMIAICPFASEFPYEVWIISKRHVDNISLLNNKELKSLAQALKLIAKKLKSLEYDFNFFAHNDIDNQHQHFYIKIQPRPNIWAGIELGSGLIINPVMPEEAATYYRK